jgi:hypothetical protein
MLRVRVKIAESSLFLREKHQQLSFNHCCVAHFGSIVDHGDNNRFLFSQLMPATMQIFFVLLYGPLISFIGLLIISTATGAKGKQTPIICLPFCY